MKNLGFEAFSCSESNRPERSGGLQYEYEYSTVPVLHIQLKLKDIGPFVTTGLHNAITFDPLFTVSEMDGSKESFFMRSAHVVSKYIREKSGGRFCLFRDKPLRWGSSIG